MSDLECPYCDAANEVCHDDGFGYEEDQAHAMECSECGKNFVFFTCISFDYSPRKADCLNGCEHRFSDAIHYVHPGSIFKTVSRYCLDCGLRENRAEKAEGIKPKGDA